MTSDSPAPLGGVPPSAQPAVQPPVVAQASNDRLWSVLCHLSYFFGFALISFLFPLTVYLVMRSDSPFVTHHAKEALNFHLSLLLYAICCIPLCFIVVGIPLLIVIGLVGIVCSIVASVKASEGICYQYPFAIRFVR
ncbi:MAG TPA: DUF4870 domain-containing protein [Opitutaceae bacterium]